MPELDVTKLSVTYPLAWDAGKVVKDAFRTASGR